MNMKDGALSGTLCTVKVSNKNEVCFDNVPVKSESL